MCIHKRYPTCVVNLKQNIFLLVDNTSLDDSINYFFLETGGRPKARGFGAGYTEVPILALCSFQVIETVNPCVL